MKKLLYDLSSAPKYDTIQFFTSKKAESVEKACKGTLVMSFVPRGRTRTLISSGLRFPPKIADDVYQIK